MKDERDFEDDINPFEAYRVAEKVRVSLGYESLTHMYEAIKNKDPVEYEEKVRAGKIADYYKNRSLFDSALRDVTFDLVMEDPNIMHLAKTEQLKRVENKMEQYATDPAYRSKYAGMARG